MLRVKVRIAHRDTWIDQLPQSLRHEFSREELEQMLEQFSDFDESGGGSIAASELIQLMKSMGIDATLEEVEALIEKVDDNRSGELEFPEFVRLISNFRQGNADKLGTFVQYSKLALQLRNELRDLTAHPTNYTIVSGIKDNAWEWELHIRGPRGTPYEDGLFRFHVHFGNDYPFEAPTLICRTRVYHPNFLMNGTMALHGFLSNWLPEWRMRGLIERLEHLFETPDPEAMDTFERETSERKALETSEINGSPTKRTARQCRDFTMQCISTFKHDRSQFDTIASQLTRQCAQPPESELE
ncbi:TPA: hypothetical protein N0F65_007060 [Lagenidium giganteum]|uniref:Calmodulin n=1 Tax=Lagenidium giganteum TaxID=4803 RepID=A0AAV2YU90_9STRA|nr:TPA: hypothetical protein N0F65_007060 [Lagenidium giganteum]